MTEHTSQRNEAQCAQDDVVALKGNKYGKQRQNRQINK